MATDSGITLAHCKIHQIFFSADSILCPSCKDELRELFPKWDTTPKYAAKYLESKSDTYSDLLFIIFWGGSSSSKCRKHRLSFCTDCLNYLEFITKLLVVAELEREKEETETLQEFKSNDNFLENIGTEISGTINKIFSNEITEPKVK